MAQVVPLSGLATAIRRKIEDKVVRPLPIAAGMALTRTAYAVRSDLRDDMKKTFDRPTPFALNAVRVISANQKSLSSVVELKEFTGEPASQFLGPQILGGARPLKNFERQLREIGVLPAGMFVVPGMAAKLDQYGNQSPTEIAAVLAAVRVGVTGNSTNRRMSQARAGHGVVRRKGIYFVARDKSPPHLPIGIYKVLGPGKVGPVMIFTAAPHYLPRFDFYALAKESSEIHFAEELVGALEAKVRS